MTLDLRLGMQFPRFDFPGVEPADVFERLSASAQAAEQNGFDTLFVMDHFWQLPMLGPPEAPMLEGYTTLAALAARTTTAKLGTLVTGVTYRNPALLAKEVTTLDVISGGRALLGIGAAWYQEEHDGLGFDFPPVKERFERLEDALRICKAMFAEERPTYEGTHHRIEGGINSPRPLTPGGPPIMIGGNGEKKTLRFAAEYADASNLVCGMEELPHKLEVLERHCADLDRDPATINKSWLGSLVIAPTHDEAGEQLDALLRGLPREAVGNRILWGDPDEVAEQVRDRVYGVGLDGVVFNLPSNGFDVETIALAGKTLNSI